MLFFGSGHSSCAAEEVRCPETKGSKQSTTASGAPRKCAELSPVHGLPGHAIQFHAFLAPSVDSRARATENPGCQGRHRRVPLPPFEGPEAGTTVQTGQTAANPVGKGRRPASDRAFAGRSGRIAKGRFDKRRQTVLRSWFRCRFLRT